MAYRSELEARLAKKTTKALVDYSMLEDGDRVMVGLSGGKDSWALLQILDVLRQRAPVRFSLVAVNVDFRLQGVTARSHRQDLARAARLGSIPVRAHRQSAS
jgi:tRNA 2-thiocytidine biosynthesis protein TtcA